MEILVIDGQGGRIGQQLIKAILARYPQVEVTAIGTNSLATSAMLKGGASQGATGENALLVACRRADVILGPLGIVIADALMGEISPAMAVAVGQARARRILIPLNQCRPPAERNSAKPGGCVSIRRVFLPAWPGYPVGPAPAGPPGAGRGRPRECRRSG